MAFLNAYLLGGLILASVPVIIHLLNRRRFQKVDWAPMKYLKLTLKTNRRRLRIEQIILLALRTLAVILLILAVARPILSAAGRTGWLPGGQRTSRFVVIDNSLSMGYSADGRTAFDRGKEALSQLLQVENSGDTVTVLTTSQPDAPLIREAALGAAPVLQAVQNATLTDTRADWPSVLGAVERAVSAATFPSRQVTIVTDLRRTGWSDVRDVAARWDTAGVKVRIIDTGSRATDNVALVSLEQEQAIALPGEPVALKARIRNDTHASITGTTAILTVGDPTAGDSSRPVLLPELPPGQTTDVPLTIMPKSAGQVPIRLSLGSDALPQDGTRYLCLDVRPTINVAMIDGEPGARPFESETDFLSLSFTLGATPWKLTKLTEPEWNAARASPPADVYVLANVAHVSAARVAELEGLVRRGAGLMIFAGDQLEQAAYNEQLFRKGTGLLPARLTGAVDVPATGLVVEHQQDSPIDPVGKLAPAALARVQAKKYLSVELPAASPDVRVLARWNNSEASPALIEKRVGRGRVLLWTVTADKAWGDWPLDPTYVLATRSAVTAIVNDDASRSNVTAGQPARVPLESTAAAVEPTAKLPGGEIASARFVEKTADAPPMVVLSSTAVAGNYQLQWKDAQAKPQTHLLGVSPDAAESDLQPIGDEELSSLFGTNSLVIVHYADESSLADHGREIWRMLAMITLSLFAAEMLLATWVGRQR